MGDEGGFAPPTRELDSLELLKEAIFTAGHEGSDLNFKVRLILD